MEGDEVVDLFLGARVVVRKGTEAGTVRYLGTTQFALGEWVGVELDEPTGKHDGTFRNVHYFDCADGHGAFVRRNTVALEFDDDAGGVALPPASSPQPKPIFAADDAAELATPPQPPQSDGLLLQRSQRRAETDDEEDNDGGDSEGSADSGTTSEEMDDASGDRHIARHAAAAAAPIIAELEAHFGAVYEETAATARGHSAYELTEATDDFATEDYASEEQSYDEAQQRDARVFVAAYSDEPAPRPATSASPSARSRSPLRSESTGRAAARALESQAAEMQRAFEAEHEATMAAARSAVEQATSTARETGRRTALAAEAREAALAGDLDETRALLALREEELVRSAERLAARDAEHAVLRGELLDEQRSAAHAARAAADELKALAGGDAQAQRAMVEEHKLEVAQLRTAHERKAYELADERDRLRSELVATQAAHDEHKSTSGQRAEQLLEALASGAAHEEEAMSLRALLEQHAQTTMDLIRENEATSAHNEELIDNLQAAAEKERSALHAQKGLTAKLLTDTRQVLARLRALHVELTEAKKAMAFEMSEFAIDATHMSLEVRTALEAQGLEIRSCMERAATDHRVSQLELLVERLRSSQRELVAQLRGAKGSVRTLCWVPTCQRGGGGDAALSSIAASKLVLPYEADKKVLHIDAVGKKSLFAFDSVHGPACRSTALLEGIDALVHSVLGGEDACLFALLPGAPGNPGRTTRGFTYSVAAASGANGMETLPLDARMASADEIELLVTERLYALMEPAVAGHKATGARFVGGYTTTVSHVAVSDPLSPSDAASVAAAVAAARGGTSVGTKLGDDDATSAPSTAWWGKAVFSAGVIRDLLRPSAPLVSGYETTSDESPTPGRNALAIADGGATGTGAGEGRTRASALAAADLSVAMAVAARSAAEVALLTSAGKKHLRTLHIRAADVPAAASFRAATGAEEEYRAQAIAAEAQQVRCSFLLFA
jgi:hypothetical protein